MSSRAACSRRIHRRCSQRLLRRAVLDSPLFTIRGASHEVLRAVAAKGLS